MCEGLQRIAVGKPTGATLAGGTYSFSQTYDNDLRPRVMTLTLASGGSTLFKEDRRYDPVGNVYLEEMTLSAGTDNQAFCYDEQNRLVWASSASGTVPCGSGGSWTAGSLASAAYSDTYSYDTLNRLTSGPLGPYTYGDSHHLDAATSVGLSGGGSPLTAGRGTPSPTLGVTAPPYSASYDAAGDMVCRSTSTAATQSCWNGNTGGAQLSYDNERRLASWQNAPTSPTTTASYAYDGEGNRVAQKVTASGGTTTTKTRYLAGGLEDVTISGSPSTTMR